MDLKDELAADWSQSRKALREELLVELKRKGSASTGLQDEKRLCACSQLKVGGLGHAVGGDVLQSGGKK